MKSCSLCERKCRIDRKHGERGLCGVGYKSRVASAFPHIGEEPELVPSGTIFFSGCNSRCVFCQNWDISQFPGMGDIWPPERIANWIMDNFTSGRIINANFVGGEPTPNTHNILKALKLLSINVPIVWNSNMY
ncbi:MAG: radical SAM protein, partial [Candidatus Micrarchaeia archaeon]